MSFMILPASSTGGMFVGGGQPPGDDPSKGWNPDRLGGCAGDLLPDIEKLTLNDSDQNGMAVVVQKLAELAFNSRDSQTATPPNNANLNSAVPPKIKQAWANSKRLGVPKVPSPVVVGKRSNRMALLGARLDRISHSSSRVLFPLDEFDLLNGGSITPKKTKKGPGN